jgi:Mg2+-importing ATPase
VENALESSFSWSLNQNDLFQKIGTNAEGLSNSEANHRLHKYGHNILKGSGHRTALKIFISQLQNWLTILLIGASILSYFLRDEIDTFVILGIVALSVLFGFVQENQAERAVEKLTKLVTHKAKVLRDKKWTDISSADIVVGDIVSLRIGDRIPADIRLLEVDQFSVDESILTGESFAVSKNTQVLEKKNLFPHEQSNIIFEGTYVVSGVAQGVVVFTGSKTQLGQTAKALSTPQPETDFQKQIKKFSVFLSKIVLVMTIFVFAANAALGKDPFDSLLFAIALAVGITPELLPMIITVTLSQGAMKMAGKKVIVKRLIAVEDFGNIDTLCIDKTGTLTEGKFTLTSYQDFDGNSDSNVLVKALLCSSGYLHEGKASNQIDTALWQYKDLEKFQTQLSEFKLVDENEFDFERRMMSVVAEKSSIKTFIVKGSAESVVPLCTSFLASDKTQKPFDNKKQSEFLLRIKNLENSGYRAIIVAEKPIDIAESTTADENNLCLLGMVAFTDPVKASTRKSLDQLTEMGVSIKILSGDSAEVLEKVATELNLMSSSNPLRIITGADIQNLNEAEFGKVVMENNFFARITPQQKKDIILYLNQDDHIVGFMGDGVNDAPALQSADVGIAVDTGSDVAKEAADIILLEKDLSVISEGILIGRKTFGNITKYILNTISANYGNMFTVSVASIFLSFIPLLPKQILLNNLISDIPLLALSTDNVDPSFTLKPKRWNMNVVSKFMLYFGLISSIFDFALILPLYFYWKVSPDVFRTAWFVESSLSEILITFAIRTHLPFYKSHPSKLLIWLSTGASFLIVMLPSLIFTDTLFDFVPLPVPVWLWIGAVLIIYFAIVEITKTYFLKKFPSGI